MNYEDFVDEQIQGIVSKYEAISSTVQRKDMK
jgi:hypothetical protein